MSPEAARVMAVRLIVVVWWIRAAVMSPRVRLVIGAPVSLLMMGPTRMWALVLCFSRP